MMKWNWTCFSFFYEHRLPLVLKEEEEEGDIDSPIGNKPIKVEIENQKQNKNKMIISKMREIRKGFLEIVTSNMKTKTQKNSIWKHKNLLLH